MSVREAMRASRLLGDRLPKWRQQPRHAGLEESLPEALAKLDAEDAAAATMTQAIPRSVPDGARHAEDIPVTPMRKPMFREHQRPSGPQPVLRTPTAPKHAVPSGANPYAAPVTTTGPIPVRRAPGGQSLSPQMQESAARVRAYREENPPDLAAMQRAKEALRKPDAPARSPEPVYDAMTTARRPQFIPRRQRAPRPAAWVQERMASVTYPACNGSVASGSYAELMRRVSMITGTFSRFEQTGSWPALAITDGGPDGRWAA